MSPYMLCTYGGLHKNKLFYHKKEEQDGACSPVSKLKDSKSKYISFVPPWVFIIMLTLTKSILHTLYIIGSDLDIYSVKMR